MKIAITADYLVEKNYYTEVIDLVGELLPEAKIYTFAHREKAISARIERHAIQSTFLSKKIFSEKKFQLLPTYLLPVVAKKFFVPCTFDLIINISHGLSQGFEKCKDTKQLTYLLDWNLEKNYRNTFAQKFFFAYFKRFFKKKIESADFIWVANARLQNEFKNAEVVLPPFKLSDYALFPLDMFPHDYYLIDTNELDFSFAQTLVTKLENEDISFLFIGKYSHLKDLKFIKTKNYFYGDRCSGEHAPVLAAAKAFISFDQSSFPKLALGTLATGRPVILHSSQHQWLDNQGTYFFTNNSLDEILNTFKKLEHDLSALSGKSLRESVLQFQENNFKNKLNQFIKSKSF